MIISNPQRALTLVSFFFKYMLLWWINALYCLGKTCEPCPPHNCHEWTVLFLDWLSQLNWLLAGAHFLLISVCVGLGRQDQYVCGVVRGGSLSGFEVFSARLSEEFESSAVLPLQAIHADIMCRQPGPRMYQCLARTKVMEIILLTYTHVLE